MILFDGKRPNWNGHETKQVIDTSLEKLMDNKLSYESVAILFVRIIFWILVNHSRKAKNKDAEAYVNILKIILFLFLTISTKVSIFLY